jgi:hypothetical protein
MICPYNKTVKKNDPTEIRRLEISVHIVQDYRLYFILNSNIISCWKFYNVVLQQENRCQDFCLLKDGGYPLSAVLRYEVCKAFA